MVTFINPYLPFSRHAVLANILKLPFKSDLFTIHWNSVNEHGFGIPLSCLQTISSSVITICQDKLTTIPGVLIGSLCRHCLASNFSRPRCRSYIKRVQIIVYKLWERNPSSLPSSLASFPPRLSLSVSQFNLGSKANMVPADSEFKLCHSRSCVWTGFG